MSRAWVLAVLAVGLLCATRAAAQVDVGVVTGPSWTSMVWAGEDCRFVQLPCGEHGSANQPRRSIAGGVSVAVPLHGRISLHSEILLVQKGFARTEPTYRLTYAEVPVLVRYTIGRSAVRPYLSGGVAPSLRLACTVQFETRDGFYRGDCEQVSPIGRSYPAARADLGVVLAGGARGRLGPAEVGVELRATRGILDVERHQPGLSLNRALGVLLRAAVPVR